MFLVGFSEWTQKEKRLAKTHQSVLCGEMWCEVHEKKHFSHCICKKNKERQQKTIDVFWQAIEMVLVVVKNNRLNIYFVLATKGVGFVGEKYAFSFCRKQKCKNTDRLQKSCMKM